MFILRAYGFLAKYEKDFEFFNIVVVENRVM